jgi:uroporphyrinogen-III synthase
VQEYGVSNLELIAGLAARGAQVTSVPVYEWAFASEYRSSMLRDCRDCAK